MNSTETCAKVLGKLVLDIENARCCDCDWFGVTWGSVTFGTFLCGDCAEAHRGFSVIKSLGDTDWSLMQLKAMVLGGNRTLKCVLKQYALMGKPIKYKYSTKAALYYREKLTKLSEGVLFDREPPALGEGGEPEGLPRGLPRGLPVGLPGTFSAFLTSAVVGGRGFAGRMRGSVLSLRSQTVYFFRRMSVRATTAYHSLCARVPKHKKGPEAREMSTLSHNKTQCP